MSLVVIPVIVAVLAGASYENPTFNQRTRGEFVSSANQKLEAIQRTLNSVDLNGKKTVLSDADLKALDGIGQRYMDFTHVLGEGCCYLSRDVKKLFEQNRANQAYNDQNDPSKVAAERRASDEHRLRLGYIHYLAAAQCWNNAVEFDDAEIKGLTLALKEFSNNTVFSKPERDKFWSNAEVINKRKGLVRSDCLDARRYLMTEFPNAFPKQSNPF
ncbi:hypothetical protein [Rhizobium sp. S163]|uniref:hypothetical protein n=1 Tax=Rhizobium sp. S163 TaxID=3055039 RepID=UPI0025A9B8B5|nr:hypothetical protein [Rhizobium sp. S163]MDM9647111.1 hypothetical protein [Rhizobium sp. S163]